MRATEMTKRGSVRKDSNRSSSIKGQSAWDPSEVPSSALAFITSYHFVESTVPASTARVRQATAALLLGLGLISAVR